MRKSREEAAETRQRIVETAAVEFCRHGISGTGLAALMAAAGLTHGGFYRHFNSKDELVVEACVAAAGSSAKSICNTVSNGTKPKGLKGILKSYLSAKHRDTRSGGCPFAALGSELARSDHATRAAATKEFERFIDIVAAEFPDMPRGAARRRALVTLSAMVGALTISRVVTDEKLSDAILRETAKHLADDFVNSAA
jgi:TetR/AcrR family transcriptional regulator, transcriptional repressor for nem operon